LECSTSPRDYHHRLAWCIAARARRSRARIKRNGPRHATRLPALHRIADLRHADGKRASGVAALLVDRGAQVDARNRDDVTPLHQAVRARNLAVVELLLARGADPNARDKRGSTPLHRAVSSTGASGTAGVDAAPFVAALLARGANPDQRDARGRSPRAAAKRGVFGPAPGRR
jgi:ankyrin repeat protein